MTSNAPMGDWVVRDPRPLDEAALASATRSQSSLGALLERLRAVRFVEVPVPDGEGVEP
jgi:hypothetical protein